MRLDPITEMDYKVQRGITRDQIATLLQREWLDRHHNVILEGATGTGKTFLCHAIARHWCEQGLRVRYLRLKRLFAQLTIAHADGTYNKLLKQLAGMGLLIVDDWGIEPLNMTQRNDLLEILKDRYQLSSTFIATQLPLNLWHETLGDATLADAIMDRVTHNAYKLVLKGEF